LITNEPLFRVQRLGASINPPYLDDYFDARAYHAKVAKTDKIWISTNLKQSLVALLIKGNPRFVADNPKALYYYAEIAKYLRKLDYHVIMVESDPRPIFPAADLWIGHSRGAGFLDLAPETVHVISFGSKRYGAINAPGDDIQTAFHLTDRHPPDAHFVFTNRMRNEIDKATCKIRSTGTVTTNKTVNCGILSSIPVSLDSDC